MVKTESATQGLLQYQVFQRSCCAKSLTPPTSEHPTILLCCERYCCHTLPTCQAGTFESYVMCTVLCRHRYHISPHSVMLTAIRGLLFAPHCTCASRHEPQQSSAPVLGIAVPKTLQHNAGCALDDRAAVTAATPTHRAACLVRQASKGGRLWSHDRKGEAQLLLGFCRMIAETGDWWRTFSILRMTSSPSPRTRPKTTCFWSSHSVLAHVTKNWHPLVLGPLFACGLTRVPSGLPRWGGTKALPLPPVQDQQRLDAQGAVF